MKPLRLKMYGIGPYAKEVEVDFDRLNEDGLFLITGATGAGKTSIFDGITYALYGETNFSDKDKTNGFICDYLDIKDHKDTYVEFTFEVDGTEYTIKRMPGYQKYKKNGEKNKNKEVERLEISSNPSKKIPENKKEMDKYIEKEILKVDASQFKKLIMLPQGAFNEFIRSDSDEKTVTLEKIFDTNIYKLVTERFKNTVGELKIDKTTIENKIFAELKTLNIDEERWNELIENKTIAFDEFLGIMGNKKNELQKEKKVIEENINKIDINKIITDLAKGETTNKSVDQLKQAKEKLEELNKKSESIEEKKKKLKIFKLANDIKVEHADKVKSAEEYKKKNEEYIKSLEDLKKYKEENDTKIESLPVLTNEIDSLNGRVKTLDLLKDDVEKYNLLLEKIEQDKDSLETYKINSKKKEELEKQELEKQEKLKKKRINIQDDISKTTELKLEKEGCKTKKIILKDIVKKYINILGNEENLEKEKEKLEELTIGEKEKFNIYQEQNKLWFESEAYSLVGQLEIGKPCPVCGSTEHPAKAEKPKNVPTKEKLSEYEESYEAVKSKRGKLAVQIENSEKNIDKERNELEIKLNEEKLENNYEDLKKLEKENNDRIKEIKVLLKTLYTSEDLKELEKEESLNIEQTKIIIEEKKKVENNIIALKKDLEHDREEHNSLQRKLEENNVTVSNFDKDYKKIVEEKNTKELEKNKIKEIKKDSEAMESTLQEKSKNLKELNIVMKEAKKLFEQKLEEKKIADEVEYIKAKIIDGNKIEEEINSYKDNLTTVKAVIGEKKDYEGIELIDLTALEKEKNIATDRIKDLNNDLSRRTFEILQLNDKQEDLKNTNEILEEKLKTLNTYTKLYSLSKGEYGDQRNKITFQNYVLGVYFEEVLDRANERFIKMTNNQYEMRLHRKKGTGTKKAGLDINVFDTHTGKERSIKTLSGGETFKASMALALGLSDVVQAQNGGIQLDSVFIDEGFGTLDEESLSTAMDILMDLKSSGRTVGIISHVNELKQTITSQIRVEKTSRGSDIQVVF